MSKETLRTLNTDQLVGFTTERGNAWHYRADLQGDEPNHYPLAVPVEDVRRRLFHWKPVEGTVETTLPDGTRLVDPTRKTIVRPDTATILGLFKDGYRVHDYDEWLIHNVETILDADLAIGSAGLLKGGAVAYVQVEMAHTLKSTTGEGFRPYLLATTSLDGSLATTYLAGVTRVVCDNTHAFALSEKDAKRLKVRHSRNSLGRVTDVRDALDVVVATGDAFDEQVRALVAQTVTDKQWSDFLKAHVPDPKPDASVRVRNNVDRERDELDTLWTSDERVSPWRGTAWGVVAAVNTHAHHVQHVRGMSRPERNMLRTVTGDFAALDARTLDTLATVTA